MKDVVQSVLATFPKTELTLTASTAIFSAEDDYPQCKQYLVSFMGSNSSTVSDWIKCKTLRVQTFCTKQRLEQGARFYQAK